MKLLLTSAGISNTSIHNALVDLLGKPVSEANAAIDDQTAIKVTDDTVEIISEGQWKLFKPF